MSAVQKHAMFNLIVIGATLALFLSAIPFLGPMRASGMFGVLGLLGFGVLFYRKGQRRREGQEPVYDERDWDIERRALFIALGTFWASFVAACMGTWFIRGDAGTIPVRILPTIVFAAWCVFQGTQSVAILVQYRRQM